MYALMCVTAFGLLAFSGPVASQVIEQRSSVRNPDGSTSQIHSRSYSQATYTGASTGPDGITVGFDLHQDSRGKITGNEWKAKDGQRLETKKIEEDASGIGSRTALGSFSNFGPNLGSFGPHFGPSRFGSGLSFGTPEAGGTGDIGGVNTPDVSANAGFPSGGLPWASFGNFGDQFRHFATPGFDQLPQYNFASFGFQQPLAIPNYSKFLLGGVGSNPNIVSDGHFANVIPRIGLNPGIRNGFGSSGFGAPGFSRRSYKHEVDPATGSSSYSYSESSGHQSFSNTYH
ncbi:uncharacterized protein LOC111249193 [Varroa destructor]|uniref:Uncharacterized protein n=1 Tax=Varroa destructor TaxID=109461 RepID=A0A7M7K6M6_VARDE|nr:uncharacterized protein LOC111249193 [Varroa destructor]